MSKAYARKNCLRAASARADAVVLLGRGAATAKTPVGPVPRALAERLPARLQRLHLGMTRSQLWAALGLAKSRAVLRGRGNGPPGVFEEVYPIPDAAQIVDRGLVFDDAHRAGRLISFHLVTLHSGVG